MNKAERFLSWATALPLSLRLSVAGGLALGIGGIAVTLPGFEPARLQVLLFAAVALATLALGLFPGLAAATVGFAVLLWWAAHRTVSGLGLPELVDAFLWFAVAKLAAALLGIARRRWGAEMAARHRAEAEAARQELRAEELLHRVGNDMQRLIAALQSEAQADPASAEALARATGRVRMMRGLHDRLTQGTPDAIVDSREFLESLGAILQSTEDPAQPVALIVQAEAHPLPMAVARDLGLAVNELVTNALKYAFADTPDAEVRIGFALGRGGLFTLTVADNGSGPPAEPTAPPRGTGRGMRLIRALAAELDGQLQVAPGEAGGTVATLRFPMPAAKPEARGRQASS